MKYMRFIMIGLVSISLIYIFFIMYQGRTENEAQNISISMNQSETNSQQWETKTDEQPPVIVRVTPIELGKNVQVWKFDIAFDTHAGSLDEDPIQIATLIDDKGNIYKPTGWEGPGQGGHHREGILAFSAVNPIPQSVELKIKDVGGISERSFKWKIQ